MSFNAAWTCRWSLRVLVIAAKPPGLPGLYWLNPVTLLGWPNCGVFVALNASRRNSSPVLSWMWKFLKSEASRLLKCGPRACCGPPPSGEKSVLPDRRRGQGAR